MDIDSSTRPDLTQASVRRQLAEAEDQEVAAGAVLLHGEVSPFSLIAQSIDLEEQQYVRRHYVFIFQN
jgi:hypothetical protein